MPNSQKIIGIYGVATQENANRLLTGVLRYAREAGGLLVRDFRIPPTAEPDSHTMPPWRGRADGVVASIGRDANATDKDTADFLVRGGVPVVSASGDWRDARIPSFWLQDRSLVQLAAKHLIGCGCRSFLYVGYVHSSVQREKAFEKALARTQHKLTTLKVASGLFGFPTDARLVRGERKLIQLLKRMPKPVGVWALNDHYARAICSLCAHLELEVPGEVKVMGVHDLFTARAESPTLSTIHTPVEEVGYLAMRGLHRLLQGESRPPPLTEVPSTELVLRESTLGGHAASPVLQETVDYIARHACSGLRVEHLAQRLHMSRRSFELKFRDFVGHSASDEIQRLRLERAKELLWQTDLSIKHICHLIGYDKTSCFSRFFSLETGLSPSEYRASAKR